PIVLRPRRHGRAGKRTPRKNQPQKLPAKHCATLFKHHPLASYRSEKTRSRLNSGVHRHPPLREVNPGGGNCQSPVTSRSPHRLCLIRQYYWSPGCSPWRRASILHDRFLSSKKFFREWLHFEAKRWWLAIEPTPVTILEK